MLYVTVHDIQLIAYMLECLYQLSELGEMTTTHFDKVTTIIGQYKCWSSGLSGADTVRLFIDARIHVGSLPHMFSTPLWIYM